MTNNKKAQKVLIALGSPRKKGNSAALAKLVGMVYGSAHEPAEIRKNTALMAEAEELGKKLTAK